MDAPPGGNVQFLAVVALFALPQVRGVGLPQFVETLLGERNFESRYKVIAVQETGRTVQTGVARADGSELQRVKPFALAEVDAAVLRVGVDDLQSRKHVAPQILARLVEDPQTFVVNATDK